MLFNSFPFAVFFFVAFAALVVVPRRHAASTLLAASIVFYGFWNPVFVPLLLGTLGINYFLLRRIAAGEHARAYLVASMVVTLSLLAYFKYASFLVGLVSEAFAGSVVVRRSALDVALPLGISFYSFEVISVAVDVYRRRLACPSFRDYALFVTFFPHLISGPIMRGNELLPQLASGGSRTPERTRRGAWLFASGLAKKAVLSDFLLMPFVSEVFAVPGGANGPVHLVAIYSFGLQIYFDFSGYTDMARGAACVLGFELPNNFAEPHLSRSVTEFWTRWHVTLSRWLRDYLYIPLGGNRRGSLRAHVNVMITMLLGGLWHGAGLNFILWGGMHGLFLIIERLRGTQVSAEEPTWRDIPAIVFTFHLICFSLIFFRAGTLSDSIEFLRGIFSGGYLRGWPILPLAIVAFCASLHVAERRLRPKLPAIYARFSNATWGPWVEGLTLGALASMAVLASGGGVEFIYFQF